MEALKPCPWCGGAAVLCRESMAGPRGTGYPGCYEYVVTCGRCGATAPGGVQDDIYQTPEEAETRAIKAWNVRGKRLNPARDGGDT